MVDLTEKTKKLTQAVERFTAGAGSYGTGPMLRVLTITKELSQTPLLRILRGEGGVGYRKCPY